EVRRDEDAISVYDLVLVGTCEKRLRGDAYVARVLAHVEIRVRRAGDILEGELAHRKAAGVSSRVLHVRFGDVGIDRSARFCDGKEQQQRERRDGAHLSSEKVAHASSEVSTLISLVGQTTWRQTGWQVPCSIS